MLIDVTMVHPTGKWLHAAITFDHGSTCTYFNGKKELAGELGYAETIINPVGMVSIGDRMNHRSWFNGYIKTLKVSHAVLDPDDFLKLAD